jgi:hypothetical protein
VHPIASFIEERDGIKRLIPGAGGDMVLNKRREESFQF